MNKHIQFFGAVLCALVVLAPLSVVAAPVLRSGESVTVSDTQEVQDDFYAAGGAVTVSGKIMGDLYTAAGTVTVNGEIKEDAVIAGGSVHIDGPVGDDIRVVGGDLTIAGAVEGDVLVLGGVLRVLSTAQIKGDLLFLGGELNMDGDLRGSLSGHAETVRINGPVLGDVSVTTAQALELGDQAHVEGTVRYTGPKDIVRAPGSVVIGDITRETLLDASGPSSLSILPLLALFFTTLAYLLLFKARLLRLMRHTLTAYGKHGLFGLGVLVGMPLVALILMVSVIGLPVGVALLLLYLLLFIVSSSLVGIFFGAMLSRYFDGEVRLSLKWALLGTLGLVLLSYIPYLGPLFAMFGTLVVLGGIASLIYGRIRT